MLGKLRAHWLAAILVSAGLALRVLAVVSYRPALFYIDTIRYLYDSGGNDPVGYRLPLRAILAIGNFDLLAIVQHLLGLAMAVTIYLVLVRRGTQHWLAALAMAPVLLDAYQVQMEQLVLPDVWFEALVVAGVAVLLLGAPPARPPALKAVIAGGLIFGVSATFRQVGEILVLPALLYLLAVSGGGRALLTRTAALLVAFVVPILAYMTGSFLLVGHFYLSHSGVTTTYGRMAAAADCAKLNLPSVERGLCPTRTQQALGPDWLEHSPRSPIRPYYTGPLSARASALVAAFNNAVLSQQPTRVLGSYLADVGKVFALSKVTPTGITPVSRWQFQTSYPYLSPHATPADVRAAIAKFGGGRPAVWHPGATALRDYQLGGGYTPGLLLAACALAGLAGSAAAGAARYRELRPRRRSHSDSLPPAEPISDRPRDGEAAATGLGQRQLGLGTSPTDDGSEGGRAAGSGQGQQQLGFGPSSTEGGSPADAAARASAATSQGQRRLGFGTSPTDAGSVGAGAAETGHGQRQLGFGTSSAEGSPAEAGASASAETGLGQRQLAFEIAPADGGTPADAAASAPTETGPGQRQLALASGMGWRELMLGGLLFFGCGAGLLLVSDLFEFSWRYQLPALVTLPPAGAAVVAAIVRRHADRPADPG